MVPIQKKIPVLETWGTKYIYLVQVILMKW